MLWVSADAVVSARVIGNTVRERWVRPGKSDSDADLATEYPFHVLDSHMGAEFGNRFRLVNRDLIPSP